MVSEDETRSPMEACRALGGSGVPLYVRRQQMNLPETQPQPLGKKKDEKKKNDLHYIWENGFLIQSINN